MHSLELTNFDNFRVHRPTMNSWSKDKQRFRPPDIRPIVPIETGRASLSQPLHVIMVAMASQMANNAENVSIWWRHHMATGILLNMRSDNGLSLANHQATSKSTLPHCQLNRKEHKMKFKLNSKVFIQENQFENVVYKMMAFDFDLSGVFVTKKI